jgi:hypothetical protein
LILGLRDIWLADKGLCAMPSYSWFATWSIAACAALLAGWLLSPVAAWLFFMFGWLAVMGAGLFWAGMVLTFAVLTSFIVLFSETAGRGAVKKPSVVFNVAGVLLVFCAWCYGLSGAQALFGGPYAGWPFTPGNVRVTVEASPTGHR